MQSDEPLKTDSFCASEAVILEIFCGTGGVTASFKSRGFVRALAVDKTRPRHPKASIIPLDLTNRHHQELVLSWIAKPEVKGVFLAPPCGTASLARLIPIAGETSLPAPLRTLDMPDGVEGLEGADLLRVCAANILYAFVADLFHFCTSSNKLCMVQNPKNSLFWSVTAWQDLQDSLPNDLYYQDHQACAYGSSRPKWTKLAANFSAVSSIDKVCSSDHEHAPWGVIHQGTKRAFATAMRSTTHSLCVKPLLMPLCSRSVLAGFPWILSLP